MSVEELEMKNTQRQRRYNRMGWEEGSNQTRVIVAEDPEHPINNAQVAVRQHIEMLKNCPNLSP